MKNILLITIIIISTLTSCDIQKKRYSKGFTITNNRNYSSRINKAKVTENDVSDKLDTLNSKTVFIPTEVDINTELTKPLLFESIEKKEIHKSTQSKKIDNEVNAPIDVPNKKRFISKFNLGNNTSISTYGNSIKLLPDEEEKERNNFALTSLILSLTLIGAPIGFAFAIIALIQLKTNPNKYNKHSLSMISATFVLYGLIMIIGGSFLLLVLGLSGASILTLTIILSSAILYTLAGALIGIFYKKRNALIRKEGPVYKSGIIVLAIITFGIALLATSFL